MPKRKQVTKETQRKMFNVLEIESTTGSFEEFEQTVLAKKSQVLFNRLCKEISDYSPESDMSYMSIWTSQILRSASNLDTNLAEGYGRSGKSYRLHFIRISRGLAFATLRNLRTSPIEIPDELKTGYRELCKLLTEEIKSLCQKVVYDLEDSESSFGFPN
jgi:four helix bundle protein